MMTANHWDEDEAAAADDDDDDSHDSIVQCISSPYHA